MTFREYQYLDEGRQEEVFLDQGVQIAERTEPGFIYHLYQLNGFYIEVKYNITFNKVQSFTPFESVYKLDPYLEMIPINWPI